MNKIFFLNCNGVGTPKYMVVASNKERAFELIQTLCHEQYKDYIDIAGDEMMPNRIADLIDLEIETENAERVITL